jgi:hypothetical protein
MAKKLTLCPEYKAFCMGQIQHNTSQQQFSYFQAWWWLYHVMGMLVPSARTGDFFFIKRN